MRRDIADCALAWLDKRPATSTENITTKTQGAGLRVSKARTRKVP